MRKIKLTDVKELLPLQKNKNYEVTNINTYSSLFRE